MPLYVAQVRFTRTNAMPEDDVVNTWHFIKEGQAEVGDAPAIAGRLADFYTAAPGGDSAKVEAFLAGSLAQAVTIKVYNLDDPIPRLPVYTGGFTMTVVKANSLPAEVALCLSFRSTIGSGDQVGRHKGRVFLGPWGTNAIAAAPTFGDARPLAQVVTNVIGAANRLLVANTLSLVWAQYSKTDDTARQVVAGWVDNAWDTQRRRGADPTARTSFP